MQRRRPVMLAILDGWGWREDVADNAVRQARTPNFDRLWAGCPHALLRTSGKDVGLPDGQMGNSEVGHLNIGAGRVVMQDLPRIGDAIASGEIAQQPALQDLIACLKASGGTCHLMGLVSPGGVHSHQDHAVGPRQNPRRRRRADAWCMPGPTAAIRRRNRPATTSRASRRRCRRRSRSRPCAAATTRWTATSAGSASRRPMPRWSTPTARAFPMRRAVDRGRLCATRNSTSSSSRRWSATIAACATATASSASISAPTACAKSSPRSSIRPSPALHASAR